MFKRLIIIVIAISFCGISHAQIQQDHWIWPDEHIEKDLFLHIGLGPKIGAGIDMATSPSFFDFRVRGGFDYQMGASLNVHVAHHPLLGPSGIGRLGLEIEALYESRRSNVGNETMLMNCLEIPIMLQFYITQNIQIEAGVTPSKLLGVSPEYMQVGGVVANIGSIKGDDLMISAGMCYKTDFGLAIGLRYNHGMSEWAENFHSKTSTAMVSVCYLFPLVK